MALIYHGQIGRGVGSTWSRTLIQGAYDTLKAATANGINFADNAGIPELYVQWYAGTYNFPSAPWFSGPHTHKDGSLGIGSIGVQQLDMAGSQQVQFIRTPAGAGFQCLVGSLNFCFGDQDGFESTIYFGNHTTDGGYFLPGTDPVVIITPFAPSYQGEKNFRAHFILTEVTSQYFKLRYETDDATNATWSGSGLYWQIFFVAVGRAPGYITSPTGV